MNEIFDAYARYYDLLYRDKDYAGESAYVASHLKRHAPHAARILELGCGTGTHAEHLARMGYAVHGVDQSESMLARATARKSGLPADIAARLSFGHGDVRSVRSGEHFDAVVSLFHVMSYQTTNADLQGRTAAAHLRPGGLFLFDFWYGPAVLDQRPEAREALEDDSIRSRASPAGSARQRGVVDVNYTAFIEEKGTGSVRQCARRTTLLVPPGARAAARTRVRGAREPRVDERGRARAAILGGLPGP
jgi:predicted TPR repeat methyltransferase